ncbi:TPA: hypothetical protein QH250_001158 [Enterobacter asburiae]|uniref:hypothetical protein n=1 Tax=Enterobacter TaxID=547 RepID=UPI00090207BB|nr:MULTISPECIES: hypothetical protein [Enterobacter]MBL5947640.1 hypothetical protein [Enterobacter asburiae]MBS0845208.1 hypothetical protein [Enterobacter asburiae]MCK6990079.1 hypothetical protein [Enterobacter asburiae]MCS3488060.1 hypothetical protein [Enterobacter sp. SLBN-59]HDS6502424.1 hypothetical protein [Enterobacter asburiae]
MTTRVIAFLLILGAFAVNAADGGNGGDGGNGSDGTVSAPGRAGCPGGTDPDASGKFYLPGTKQQCNPGKQDAVKSARQSDAE